MKDTGPKGNELPESEQVETLVQSDRSDRAFQIYRSTLEDADKYLDGRLMTLMVMALSLIPHRGNHMF